MLHQISPPTMIPPPRNISALVRYSVRNTEEKPRLSNHSWLVHTFAQTCTSTASTMSAAATSRVRRAPTGPKCRIEMPACSSWRSPPVGSSEEVTWASKFVRGHCPGWGQLNPWGYVRPRGVGVSTGCGSMGGMPSDDSTPVAKPVLSPLAECAIETERHVASAGWDQPPRLFAIARNAELLDREPALAG